jgi:hypothetical protein
MKDWKEKMLEAMIMMKEACKEKDALESCKDCPFSKYCDDLFEGSGDVITPDKFIIKM